MKHNKMRKQRVKQCLNLVELIRSRIRNQSNSFSRSSSYRRKIRSRGNIASDNNRLLGLSFSQNQNYAFSQNPEVSAVSKRSSSSWISSDCASQKEIVRNYCKEYDTKINTPLIQKLTTSKLASQEIMLPGGTMNSISISFNKAKFRQEHDGYEEPKMSDDNENHFLHSKEAISEKIDISTPQQTQNSSAVFDLLYSNESEEFHFINEGLITENAPFNSQSDLRNIDNTFISEHVSSRQILADEEAGGDGHHNNSIIEIEITLQSSNDTNPEEEVEVDDDEPVLELGE